MLVMKILTRLLLIYHLGCSQSSQSILSTRGISLHITHLCLPETSLHEHLIWELHTGGLGGHFGLANTVALVED
jgi:hypothetical protein